MSHYEAVRDSVGVSPPGTPLSEPDNPVSIIETETLYEALESVKSLTGPKSTVVDTDTDLDPSEARIDPKSRSPGLRWWRRLGDIPMAFNNTVQIRDFKGISFWHSHPLAHWRFARAEPGESISSKDVIDTGDLYRATIPFYEADDRASLEFYHGPAMVTNSRTACVGPTFMSFKIDYYPVSNISSPELILRAEFQTYIDKIFDMREEKYLPMTAECKLINDWDTGSSQWPITMCRVIPQTSPYQKIYDFYPRLLVTAKEPLNKPLDMRHEDDDLLDEEQSYEEYLEEYLAQFANLTAKKDGPWTKAVNGDGDGDFEATVCFTRQIPELMYNVNILGQAVSSESGYVERADKVIPGRLQPEDGSFGPYRSKDAGNLHLYDSQNPTKYKVEEHEHGVRYDPYGFADVLDSIELSG
ncbi:hypothetical protein ACKAV7_013957 [Fusarium commune]